MTTWIFQANPDRFDVDGFLATRPTRFRWSAQQQADLMAIGDDIYLWRAKGARGVAAIVAKTKIVELPSIVPDDEASVPFWASGEINVAAPRVMLELLRVATPDEALKADWLREDPVLRTLGILAMPRATNYRVTTAEATRLDALWMNTGRPWNRGESLGGLVTYIRTKGGEISRQPGSPVVEMALRIGRVPTGVYNKVMNFRALDPTDPRKGLSGGGVTDRRVWDEFFDPAAQRINVDAVEREFARLWGDTHMVPASAREAHQQLEDASREAEGLDLSDLLTRYDARRKGQSSAKPAVRAVESRAYDRDPYVVAITKKQAGHRCEIPDCPHPLFAGLDGRPYVEVHHILPLAEGGVDTLENAICLCPGHHKEAHFGREASSLRQLFHEVRQRRA
ncbi:EVE domain-containing protein [Nitrospirillum amazonense]|nr:EVE domain-containing protein [Nitrospirillum amazonense]